MGQIRTMYVITAKLPHSMYVPTGKARPDFAEIKTKKEQGVGFKIGVIKYKG